MYFGLVVIRRALIGLLLLTCAIEGGFQVRHFLDQPQAVPAHSGSISILLLGDSVMGGFDDPDSLATQLNRALHEKFGSNFQLINQSEPALSSYRASRMVGPLLEKYHPDLVVLLLGSSDYLILQDAIQEPSRLLSVHRALLQYSFSYRLANFWWSSMRQNKPGTVRGLNEDSANSSNWIASIKLEKERLASGGARDWALDRAWDAIGRKDCKSAIHFFETAFAQTLPTERTLTYWGPCYFTEHLESQGAAFFARLADQIKPSGHFLKLFALRLSAAPLPRNDLSWENFALQMTGLIARREDAAASALFLRRNEYSLPVDAQVDGVHFRSLVSQIRNAGGRLAILKYPSFPTGTFTDMAFPGDSSIEHIELSRIVEKKMYSIPFTHLFAEDYFHLSPVGAKVIAQALEPELERLVGKANP